MRVDDRAVRVMRPDDVEAAAVLLARSLADDPAWHRALPDDVTRIRRHARLLGITIPRIFLPGGDCWVIEAPDGRLAGAALWLPLGHEPPIRTMLAVAPRLAWLLGRRSLAVAKLSAELERQRPPDRHLYLAALGVDPELQGHGFGARLLAPVLARCDREAMPAYLESSNPRNRGFYLRCGFEPVGEIVVATWPPLLRLSRPPPARPGQIRQ
jgi:GNAT superfamily N-acetyltransferase